jgi:hypothetical protein
LIPPQRQEHIVATLEKGHQEAKQRLAKELPDAPGLSLEEINNLTLARLLG